MAKRVFDRQSIKRIRQERGLTLRGLGEKLGMSHQQVSALELGPGKPNMHTFERLMEALDAPETHFFCDQSQSQ